MWIQIDINDDHRNKTSMISILDYHNFYNDTEFVFEIALIQIKYRT